MEDEEYEDTFTEQVMCHLILALLIKMFYPELRPGRSTLLSSCQHMTCFNDPEANDIETLECLVDALNNRLSD